MNYSSGSGGSQEPSVPDTPQPTPAIVTITGTGNATYCYATINGTKYSSAAVNIEVIPGDVITFGVCGPSNSIGGYDGFVEIDGVEVLTAPGSQTQTTKTYDWTVPDGVTSISISLAYLTSAGVSRGTIVVTTSSGSSNLITFTIEGTSYQSVPGMTWEEWVQSTYNTDNLWRVDQGNLVLRDGPYSGTFYIVQFSSEDVSPSDEIVSGRSYTTQFG